MTVIGKATVILDGDTIALTKSLAGAEAAMAAAGARMASIGRTMMMHLSLPLAAAGGMAVKMAGEFDVSMRRIEGLVGIARKEIEEWEPAIHAMAIATGRSAKEAGDALFFITSAGLRGDAALNVLNVSLRAAAAGLGETKLIADAATSAMNAYGAANMSAERAVEIITVAVREGKMEAESLAPTLGKVISVAANLGVEFEQVAGVLAVFSRVGVDAAMGTTQLGAIMSALMKPSRMGAVELQKVGLSYAMLRDVIKGPTGLIDVMRLLDAKFGDNDEVLTKIIPNLRALRGLMAILGQDVAVVDKVMSNVRNSQGVLNKAFAAAAEGPMLRMKIAWEQMGETLEVLGKSIFPLLVPLIQKIGSVAGGLTVWFAGLSTGTKNLIVAFGGLVIASGPVVWAIGFMLKGFGPLLTVLKAFPAALLIAKGVLFQFTAAMGVAQAASLGMANGLRYGLSGAIMYLGNLLTPQGVIIIGLAALAYLFVRTQMKVAAARREMLLATQQLEAGLAARSPEQAILQLTFMDARIAGLRARMTELRSVLNPLTAGVQRHGRELVPAAAAAQDLATALGNVVAVSDAAQGAQAPAYGTSAQEQRHAAAREELADIEATLTGLTRQRAVLAQVADTESPHAKYSRMVWVLTQQLNAGRISQDAFTRSVAAAAAIMEAASDGAPVAIPTGTAGAGGLGDAVKDAMDALTEAQRQADMLGTLGASGLEVMTAKAEGARSAILALAGANAPLTQVLNAQGLTLGQLITQYQGLNFQVKASTDATTRWNEGFARLAAAEEEAKRIIEQTLTPLERYAQTERELRVHLDAKRISQEQFNRALAAANKTMLQAEGQANALDSAMRQWAANSLDSFINFTIEGTQSFKDFANSIIRELERIALKMLIMQGLKSLGISLPGYAAGGFIEPGQLALVGEAGPEIISGGRGGLTVTPMRMPSGVSGGSRGGDVFNIHTTLAPQLIDGRSGQAWLREQRGTITEIIIEGVRRSAGARAAIVGG